MRTGHVGAGHGGGKAAAADIGQSQHSDGGRRGEGAQPRGTGKGYGFVAVAYLLGLCMGALDMGIVNPARTVIQNTLGVDDGLGVWILTIYTLAYAVSIPIMGKLADRHGRKRVYLLCIALFGTGSALCGVAQDVGSFGLLIGARVVQALGGGGIMPVATAEFGTAFPEEKRGMALGIVGMVYGLASILGPTAGSLILDVFGADQWQFIFYVNIPICLVVLVLGLTRLPQVAAEETKPVDGLGIALLALMTLSLMYGLKNIDFFDFGASIASLDVWPFLVAFAVMLPAFVAWERKASDPVLNLSYFTDVNIVITFVCAIVSGIAMMGTIFFPQFCENAMTMESGSGGYFIALLGLGSGVGAMMSGKLIDAHGVKPVLGVGFVGVMLGSLFMAFVACRWPNLITVIATMVITGLGLGFTMGTPLNYMMLQNTDERESNSALASLSLLRSIGTAVAPAIMVAFVVHASSFMQDNLMGVMPKEVGVSELPYARELDGELASLRETEEGKEMLAGVDIPELEGYATINVDMGVIGGMDGSGIDYEMSDEALEKLESSDVTTIVEACKFMSSEMFSAVKPGLVADIQDGIAGGIASMQDGVDEMDAALDKMGPMAAGTQLAERRDELSTTIEHLKAASDAVPAMFDEAEQNYLLQVDEAAAAIQEEYRQTLNGGFKGMALFVATCSLAGLLVLVPYKDKRSGRDERRD